MTLSSYPPIARPCFDLKLLLLGFYVSYVTFVVRRSYRKRTEDTINQVTTSSYTSCADDSSDSCEELEDTRKERLLLPDGTLTESSKISRGRARSRSDSDDSRSRNSSNNNCDSDWDSDDSDSIQSAASSSAAGRAAGDAFIERVASGRAAIEEAASALRREGRAASEEEENSNIDDESRGGGDGVKSEYLWSDPKGEADLEQSLEDARSDQGSSSRGGGERPWGRRGVSEKRSRRDVKAVAVKKRPLGQKNRGDGRADGARDGSILLRDDMETLAGFKWPRRTNEGSGSFLLWLYRIQMVRGRLAALKFRAAALSRSKGSSRCLLLVESRPSL